jgi:hypothetical protein
MNVRSFNVAPFSSRIAIQNSFFKKSFSILKYISPKKKKFIKHDEQKGLRQ